MPRDHKSLPRAFVAPPLSAGATVALDRDHANHLLTVLRLKEGDAAILFKGRDGAWLARLARAGKQDAVLDVVARTSPQSAPSDLWFGFAPLKTGRLDYLVQKATEMGAGTIQPVLTEFTQVRRLRGDKLRAWVLEAAEQCEVLSLPVLAPEIGLAALLEGWRSGHGLRRLLFADETAPAASPAKTIRKLKGLSVGLLVGPEGGFSDAERELLLAHDFVDPISLGPRILRADTAAVAALAVVQSIIGDWR
jgi:16S rRNA (uracil1498-N3)-methyltransferase